MSGPDVAGPVRNWVTKAEGDLISADALLRSADVPAWSPAFHLQQCAEKYIKALLTFLEIGFPKSHDIGELIALLPGDQRPPVPAPMVADLTEYAAAGRYPGRSEPTIEEVREAIESVRGLRAWVRQRLPPGAVGPP